MNTELALAVIESRMRDMGYSQDNYSISFRHCVLQGSETIEIEAYNEFYFLEHDPVDVLIRSDFGFYDLSNPTSNELKYEHQGSITLRNLSGAPIHVRFIQVIIKNTSNKK